ncbi:retrovirus-related pol polyprotein from transposon TNT 1-94 [Tanacetum coccineum]
MKIKESLNVTFDETPPLSKTSPLVDDDLDEEEAIKATEKKNLENDIEDETLEIDEVVNIKESRNHPLENVIGNLNQRTLRNKLDENDVVSRNKARLVAQGYNQQEGIDYDETYAPVARLESIRILLAYACALDFKLFQMDVKSVFPNGFINEEVIMPRKTAEDHQNTKSYLPKILNEYNAPLKHMFRFLENRCIYKGRVVYEDFDELVYVRSMFGHIGFECILEMNEQRGEIRSIGKGIKNLWRKKKKPSNPLPLQSHPLLDITLSLLLITPLDHILDTPSPPLPQPPPQPPLIDEMNLVFAHLEFLLTSAIASPSPPHP